MKRTRFLFGAALALSSAWALAQEAPESLLPPGFQRPAAKPTVRATATPAATPTRQASSPAPVPVAPGSAPTVAVPVTEAVPAAAENPLLARLQGKVPSLDELEKMSPEQLEDLLGLRPSSDIPPAARRAMRQVGVIDASEGGFPSYGLVGQNSSLIRAALEGNKGQLVSRWGHILLRRALASRLDAPAGLDPADFTAQRAALLVRMGEGDAARALVQDVDSGNFNPALTQAAVDSYLATGDVTGICPAVSIQGGARKDTGWYVLRALCGAFEGRGEQAFTQLDQKSLFQKWPKVDVQLAQKYAGAAGSARRLVNIDWAGVSGMNPWRYALATSTGVTIPPAMLRDAEPRFTLAVATAPGVALTDRAAAADMAGGVGVLSSAAMIDLYGQIYAEEEITGPWADRAVELRQCYVAESAAQRMSAMRKLWDEAENPQQHYSRMVLTAYAAARLPVSQQFSDDAGELVASMLAAGLDRNALRWSNEAKVGSQAWALLALAAANGAGPVEQSSFESFSNDDPSDGKRRSRFLLAGLAGLGRIDREVAGNLGESLGVNLDRQTRWTKFISGAAEVRNATLVALLAGVGMQGSGWDKMTALHLYHIVSALHRVGLDAEARMIAAEAVARG